MKNTFDIYLILIGRAVSVAVGSGASTLSLRLQVCCWAPLGWLWQGPPNVRR